jgi:hypothetical protein
MSFYYIPLENEVYFVSCKFLVLRLIVYFGIWKCKKYFPRNFNFYSINIVGIFIFKYEFIYLCMLSLSVPYYLC